MKPRIIIKIGSSSLTSIQNGLDLGRMRFIVDEISGLILNGYEVLLVSSGAVAAGFKQIGYKARPVLLHEKQAAAAVGQVLLMQAYQQFFSSYEVNVAQVLLTRSDFSRRTNIRNALDTLNELLEKKIIPIINENDTVSVDELKFGDNDALSALVANLVKANQLLIFTDTDGLYTEDPRKNVTAKRIERVEQIDEHILSLAGKAGSAVGTGGMHTKIEAARIAALGGIPVFIGKLEQAGDLFAAIAGQGRGTYFDSHLHNIPMKKQWIAFHSIPRGQVMIDAGAEQAILHDGRSLLPAGVVDSSGEFHPGDVVEVIGSEHNVIGRGIINYSDWQLQATAGLSSSQVKQRVDVNRIEVIHRDEWVSLQS